MPFVAALVGWSTKIVALEMLYRPMTFIGIGPIGWQGIIPRRAGKTGSKTIELLTSNLLKPEELLDRLDAVAAVEALHDPITQAVNEIASDLAEQLRPGLWDSLPDAVRNALLARIRARIPHALQHMTQEMRTDLSRYVDVQFLAVTTLVRNKDKLVRLMRGMTTSAMAFMRRSGIYFGLAIGLLQMVTWALLQNPWIMPVFGFSVGFLSDYIALNMLFRPIRPTKYLGFIRFQGLLHAQRDDITRKYAKIVAEDLFSPEILLDGMLNGPGAEQVFTLISNEVEEAIRDQAGYATPLIKLAVGTTRFNSIKDAMACTISACIPATLGEAQAYAMGVLDLESTIIEKMNMLTNEEYESILRPVFKDDEPTLVAVGAILGGIVGEIQVQIVEQFGRHPDAGHAAVASALQFIPYR